jgi:hypothetical protein
VRRGQESKRTQFDRRRAGQFHQRSGLDLPFRLAAVSVLGPVSYSWIVFAAILGFVLFGEVPDDGTILGAVIIVIGGIRLALLKPANN